ncbi:MAG: NAD(P)-dependent alcohol dehydrogenase [Chloroflexota bacterium]
MKAIVCHNYGGPDVLQLEEIAKPVPKENEVLVKIHAASINSWDWDLLKGDVANRLIFGGYRKPKLKVIGCDIAGRVEAIGENVTKFQLGDDVFGDLCASGWGGFAEYACAHENALALKSPSLTFKEAAAVPQAGVMALQGLRDNGQIQPGQTMLMNGAGGGVGTFAIQMAKAFGAEVTGVDSADKLEMLRSIGADHVIDYKKEDFTQNGRCYDLILDVVGKRSVSDYNRVLNPQGTYFMIGGPIPRILQNLLLGAWISKREPKKMGLLLHEPNKDLPYMNEFFEEGKVKPIVDRCYPLADVADAFRYFVDGEFQGKIVITMD